MIIGRHAVLPAAEHAPLWRALHLSKRLREMAVPVLFGQPGRSRDLAGNRDRQHAAARRAACLLARGLRPAASVLCFLLIVRLFNGPVLLVAGSGTIA